MVILTSTDVVEQMLGELLVRLRNKEQRIEMIVARFDMFGYIVSLGRLYIAIRRMEARDEIVYAKRRVSLTGYGVGVWSVRGRGSSSPGGSVVGGGVPCVTGRQEPGHKGDREG